MANDDGAEPVIFTGEVAVVGGEDGGDVVGSGRAEDVVAGVLIEWGNPIAPADADEAVAGEKHGGAGAGGVATHEPVVVGGGVGEPVADELHAVGFALGVDIEGGR